MKKGFIWLLIAGLTAAGIISYTSSRKRELDRDPSEVILEPTPEEEPPREDANQEVEQQELIPLEEAQEEEAAAPEQSASSQDHSPAPTAQEAAPPSGGPPEPLPDSTGTDPQYAPTDPLEGGGEIQPPAGGGGPEEFE